MAGSDRGGGDETDSLAVPGNGNRNRQTAWLSLADWLYHQVRIRGERGMASVVRRPRSCRDRGVTRSYRASCQGAITAHKTHPDGAANSFGLNPRKNGTIRGSSGVSRLSSRQAPWKSLYGAIECRFSPSANCPKYCAAAAMVTGALGNAFLPSRIHTISPERPTQSGYRPFIWRASRDATLGGTSCVRLLLHARAHTQSNAIPRLLRSGTCHEQAVL